MSNGRSLAVAQYLLDQCHAKGDSAVTPMQLIKMTYIAHGWMLGLYSRPLLTEETQAWRYGPVVPSVYHALKEYRSLPVDRVPGAPRHQFDELETDLMNQIADIYGKINGAKLSALTHQSNTPWDITWRQFGQNACISNDIIENFYQTLAQDESASHATAGC